MAHFKRRRRHGLRGRCPCCHSTRTIGVTRTKRLPVSAARVVQDCAKSDLIADDGELDYPFDDPSCTWACITCRDGDGAGEDLDAFALPPLTFTLAEAA